MGNPYLFMKRLESHWMFLLVFALITSFIYPQAALGRKAAPAKKEDVISALINISINGTFEDKVRRKKLSLTINASGKLRNESRAVGMNQYLPEGMNAKYEYEYTETDLQPPQGCPPLALEEKGSGSVNIESVMAGASDANGAFLLQVFTGLLGRTYRLQATKRAGPETMMNLSKQPASDNYSFVFAPVPMKVTKKVRKKCPQYEFDERDNKRVFALTVPFAELTQGKMSGSYSWSTKKVPYKSLTMQVTNLQGNITYEPKKEPGEVEYKVNWVFGKIKEIEILREVKKPKEEWKHITNKENPVMVGEKIRLKAVVQPGEKPAPQGTWDLGEIGPEGNVIKKYKANFHEAEVIYLDPSKDLNSPETSFYIYKGDKLRIKYQTQEGSAETTLIINKPAYTLEVKPSPSSSFKKVDKGAELSSKQCWVTSAYQGGPRYGVQYNGIYFNCALNDRSEGEIQWVQIIQQETSRMKDEKSGIGEWLLEEALDLCYPYQYGEKAKDAPAVFVPEQEPGKREVIFASKTQTNRMYLMFRPKQKESEWVPLKVIPWEWTGALQKSGSEWDMEPVITKAPKDVTAEDAEKYPVWKKNSGDPTKYKRIR